MLDAEIVGARKALEAALRLLERENWGRDGRQKINVLTNSHSAVKAVLTGIFITSLDDVCQFRALSKRAQFSVKWIQGNKDADIAARSYLRQLPSKESQPGSVMLTYVCRLINRKLRNMSPPF